MPGGPARCGHGVRRGGGRAGAPVSGGGAAIMRRVQTESDEALMLAYRGGDARAFAALFDRHERSVYRFLLRSTKDAAVADDLLQEVWLAVVRNASAYAARAKFRTWLFAIARSKLIDHWRTTAPQVSLDDCAANDPDDTLAETLAAGAAAQPDVQALSRAQARAFLAAVEALPPPQREAFLLHAEGGLSVEEVAHATGVGFETAKSRLRYALGKLRAAMQEWR
jgi:RNA polymerase sigma factor (sigma-70 family)